MNNISKAATISAALTLAGCNGAFYAQNSLPIIVQTPTKDTLRSTPRPGSLMANAPSPSSNAKTVEQFDTTSSEQRIAASKPTAGGRKLGSTIAALGDPTEAGFWIKTPLVSAPARGRLEYTGSGKSVSVTLIPLKGAKTAGSRVSLAAMRLLEAPLAGLPELIVYAD